MGLGSAAVKLYLELWQRGFFKNIKSAIDIGSQELHLTKENFEELVRLSGILGYKEEKFRDLAHWPGYPRVSAKVFYEMLGIQNYASLDLNGDYGAIKHDLNFPLDDHSLYGRYDLVTDHGANEHAFNIAEAYRTLHRLCSLEGFIVIAQSVYKGNGYYLFDSSFFQGLAAANNYRILFSSYTVAIKDNQYLSLQFHLPVSRELLETLDWSKIESIGICYVFQKQSDADFHYPYQGEYLQQINHNFGYRLQFLTDPPSYSYVPVYKEDLSNLGTKTLLNVLLRRIPQILRRKLFKR